MEFSTIINWTGPFPCKGLLGCIFSIFIQILIENSLSKQWRPWSDAALCGSALFAYVPQKGREAYLWVKIYTIAAAHIIYVYSDTGATT